MLLGNSHPVLEKERALGRVAAIAAGHSGTDPPYRAGTFAAHRRNSGLAGRGNIRCSHTDNRIDRQDEPAVVRTPNSQTHRLPHHKDKSSRSFEPFAAP